MLILVPNKTGRVCGLLNIYFTGSGKRYGKRCDLPAEELLASCVRLLASDIDHCISGRNNELSFRIKESECFVWKLDGDLLFRYW